MIGIWVGLFKCEPIPVYGEHQLRSSEGAQQGDPLHGASWILRGYNLHPLLTKLQSTVSIGFMDDITLAGDIRTVETECRHHYQPWCWHCMVANSTSASVKSLQKTQQPSVIHPFFPSLWKLPKMTWLCWGTSLQRTSSGCCYNTQNRSVEKGFGTSVVCPLTWCSGLTEE